MLTASRFRTNWGSRDRIDRLMEPQRLPLQNSCADPLPAEAKKIGTPATLESPVPAGFSPFIPQCSKGYRLLVESSSRNAYKSNDADPHGSGDDDAFCIRPPVYESSSLRVYSSVSQFDRGLNGRALVFGVHRLFNPLNIEPQPRSAALPASPNSPSHHRKPFTEPPLRRICSRRRAVCSSSRCLHHA